MSRGRLGALLGVVAAAAALLGLGPGALLVLGGPPAARAAVTESSRPGGRVETALVSAVYDGDTLTLSDGRRVRLLQIDTPELGSGECYSRVAASALRALARPGSTIRLEADPALDGVDRYGRLLRYVVRGSLNVNLELVRSGAAAPYFYRGERGRYSAQILAAAVAARGAKRGLWGACPSTRLVPDRAVDSGTSGPAAAPRPAAPSTPAGAAATTAAALRNGCDPAYPGVCIPPAPPDLDCGDIPYRRFRVLAPDPHNFDGRDHDGIGCESG